MHSNAEFDDKVTNSIIYPASLSDDRVDEGIHESLISDVAGSCEYHNFAIDLGKLFSGSFKLLLVDVCDGDAFTTAVHKSFGNRCSNT